MKSYDYTKRATQEQIDDLMVTALEGGITYWCGEARIKQSSNADDVSYLSEEISRGGVLELFVDDEGWRELTLEKLLKGLSLTTFDFEDYDAGDADRVVQLALFGEVVYA